MSILILDIGTTSMRGILYDLHGSKKSVCQLPNHVHAGADGWVTEPAADWEENTVQIIRNILADTKDDPDGIEAVAITSQRSSIIPVNREGEPLMDAIMWQDTRNREICEELKEYNDSCFERTGSFVNAVFSGSKMTWVRRKRPDLYPQIHKFVNIPEYLNFIMTGEYCSDYTYASRTGLMNLRHRTWDPKMLFLYKVDADKLCRLYEPGSIVGKTSAEFEARTGLKAGTPVIHCGGDQQCAAVGQGVTREGNACIVLGTGGFLLAALDEVPAHLKPDVICNASSVAGKYIIEANVLSCSAAFDWFAHEMYGMDRIDYDFLENEIRKHPGMTDCLVIPYFEGRGAPDWNASARGVFAGISLASSRGGMLKGMMESIFMEMANHLDSFREYVPIRQIFISGGMTGNETLNQLLADVLGMEVTAAEDKEATAFGALRVALTGLGYYPSVEAAMRETGRLAVSRTYIPDMDKHELYEGNRFMMNTYYERNK